MRGSGVRTSRAFLVAALMGLSLAAPAGPQALQRGQAAFRRGNWVEAEKSFLAAIREQPKSATALKWLGMVYTAQEKFDLAEAPFRSACEIDPGEDLACYYLGRADYALSRYEESRSAFEKALRYQPDSIRIKRGMGVTLEALGRGRERQGGALRLRPIPLPPGAPQRKRGRAPTIRRSGEPGKGGARTGRGSRPGSGRCQRGRDPVCRQGSAHGRQQWRDGRNAPGGDHDRRCCNIRLRRRWLAGYLHCQRSGAPKPGEAGRVVSQSLVPQQSRWHVHRRNR